MPSTRHRPRPSSSAAGAAQPRMSASLASLDAKLKLIAQRLKIMENNEQVIGRTLVSHNKKMKELEALAAAGGGKGLDLARLKDTIRDELKAELMGGGQIAPPLEHGAPTKRTSSEIINLRKSVEELRQEVNELKYVVDSINPLEYITLDQLNDVVTRKIEKARK
ncbi:MAG: hypothetical protein KAW41_04335 [Candidatus Diapherotrites archaeon]|nr:hypothetical protein [Candidatus Diapherotrites archaeon]